MWKAAFCLIAVLGVGSSGFSQSSSQSMAIDLANMREDVRLLNQRTGEMALRLERLERENAELKRQVAGSAQSYATVVQLNEAVAEINRTIRSSSANVRAETLQQVKVQMEQLAQKTNAAIDSLAKGVAAQPSAVQTPTFSDNFPKEGIKYTVQSGDSLALIARVTGAKLQDIINANRIADPNKLTVGQELFIPGGK